MVCVCVCLGLSWKRRIVPQIKDTPNFKVPSTPVASLPLFGRVKRLLQFLVPWLLSQGVPQVEVQTHFWSLEK